MSLLNLSEMYKILEWHSNRPYDNGHHVGLFLPLPVDVARQFPDEGRSAEDSSPVHTTLVYIGDFPMELESKLVTIVNNVCEKMKPFTVKLGAPKKFKNDDNQTILHSPITSKKLKSFHSKLKNVLVANQIPVSTKYPEYKPHVTIEYVNEGDKPKFKKTKPKGEWVIDSLWVWGTSEPYLVCFGK